MKNPITKLAVAAAVVAAVLIGIGLFSNSGSGVVWAEVAQVWAEVAQRVQASPGVIFRIAKTDSKDPNENWPDAYTIIRRSATLSRTDWCRNDQIHRMIYFNLNAKTKTWVAHDAKVYVKVAMSDQEVASFHGGWTDPQALVGHLMSAEYHELGEKTIDGVLCEGTEATDPSKGRAGRLWVSVETGYPVLLETGVFAGDGAKPTWTSWADQFQWNVDLVESEMEPEIPADYRFMD